MDEWSRQMQTILDEMRRRSFCDFRSSGTWEPSLNIYAVRASYHVCVPLSGVEAHHVAVHFRDPQRLCISGHRARPEVPQLNEPFSIEIMEIDEGAFQREIELPEPVDVENVEVRHEKGFIWITLRKSTKK